MAKTAWLGAAKPVGRVPQNGSAPTPPGKAGPRAGLRTGVAVVLVVVGVGGGVIAYQRSAQRSAVLVVGQTLTQGQVIRASDLQVAHMVPIAGVSDVPAADEASVVGQHAAVPLAPGALLVPGDLTGNDNRLSPGQVEIGAALGPTQIPAEGVSPGEAVEVTLSPTSASAVGATSGTELAVGTVMTVAHGSSGTSASELVSLRVPAGNQAAIEAAAATSSVGLVAMPTPGR